MTIKKAVDNYSVDELGNVYSRTGRLLKCSCQSGGYMQLFAWKNGALDRTYLVHRLVWMAFKGEIPQGFEIDHIDGNKKNNALTNLRIVSHRDNMIAFRGSVKGYWYSEKRKKYIAQIFVDGKRVVLGSFSLEEDAKKAYADANELRSKKIVELDRGDK